MNAKRLLQVSLIFLLSSLLVACGDDPEEGNNGNNTNNGVDAGPDAADAADAADAPDAEGEAFRATFETYNVGLARGFVPNAAERAEPVAAAVSESPADVACLQEVWLFRDEQDEWSTDQIDTIVDESSETFPHNYFEITEAGESVSCTAEEADPLETCVRANCDGVPDADLAECALAECGDEFDALSTECQSCVAGQIGGSLDDILNACAPDGEGASEFSYNGHNGLLMLSRHEMRDTSITSFESTLVQRSALHAVVTVPDVGDVDLYCTHLAASLSDVPYPGGTYESYEEEQAAQIAELLDFVNDTSTTGNVVVMGDMNTGPAAGDNEAEFPANYNLFIDADFASPYAEQDAPDCTFCAENTLTDAEASDNLIDHIFLQLTLDAEVVNVERAYDETQEIDGEQMNLSDHYGVRVTVETAAE